MQSYQARGMGQVPNSQMLYPQGQMPVYYLDGTWSYMPVQSYPSMQYEYQAVARRTSNTFFQYLSPQEALRGANDWDIVQLASKQTMNSALEYIQNNRLFIDPAVFFHLVSRTRNSFEVMALLAVSSRNNPNMNFFSYAMAHCKNLLNDNIGILAMYDSAKVSGKVSNDICFFALEAARDLRNTKKLLEIFYDNPFFRTPMVYGLIIKYLGNNYNYNLAKDIYNHIPLNDRSIQLITIMITIAGRNNDYNFAKLIYQKIPDQFRDAILNCRMISIAGRNGDYHFAKNVFDRTPLQTRDGKTYGAFIQAAYSFKQKDAARMEFEAMPSGAKLDPVLNYIVIFYELQLGHVDYAVKVYDSLQQDTLQNVLPSLEKHHINAINNYKRENVAQHTQVVSTPRTPLVEAERDEHTMFLNTRNGPAILDFHSITLEESVESFQDFVQMQDQGFEKCFVDLNPTITDGLFRFKDQIKERFPDMKCCFSLYNPNRLIVQANIPMAS